LRLRGEMGSGVSGFREICEGKERRKEEGYLLPFSYNEMKMGCWTLFLLQNWGKMGYGAFFWAYL